MNILSKLYEFINKLVGFISLNNDGVNNCLY